MSNNFNEAKQVSFNIPKAVNFELLFNDISPVYLPKIHFLINQINFNTNNNRAYQLNTQNHKWFLGINGKDLTTIVNRLLDNEIIKRVGFAKKGKVSNAYQMVQSFDVKNMDESISITYPVSKYIFIQKWLADGYIVKAKKFSAFQKDNKTSTKEQKLMTKLEQAQAEIEALKARISELEINNVKDIASSISNKIEPLIKSQTVAEPDGIIDLEGLPDWDDEAIISQPVEAVGKTMKDYNYNLNDGQPFITFQLDGQQGFILKDKDLLFYLEDFSESDLIDMMEDFTCKPAGNIIVKYNHKLSLRFDKAIEGSDMIIVYTGTIKTMYVAA